MVTRGSFFSLILIFCVEGKLIQDDCGSTHYKMRISLTRKGISVKGISMMYASRTCIFCCLTRKWCITLDLMSEMSYAMAVLSSVVFKVVPLESDLGDVPVIDHKPSKLPLFKKQYENKVFIGKSF